MKAAAFVFGQPATIYFCGKHTAHEANFRFFDGHVVDKSNLHQFNPSPNLALSYDNNVTDKLVLDTFGIVRCVFDGASSYIQVNNEAGDGGSTGAASFDGFTVGARYDGAGGNCAIVVKEIICRTVHDSAGDQTAIINYLNAKYTIY